MRPRTVLRGAGMALAVGFVALLVYGLTTSAPDSTIDDALSRGEAVAAPGFALAPLEGRDGPAAWRAAARDGTVELRELRGRPLVVNFWASWCDPCRAEAKVLEAGWREARADDVLFVGVDTQDNREDAREFIAEFGLTFPHVRAPDRDTDRRWGVTGLPETYFVDARGRVVAHVVGTVDERSLAEGIGAARAGRPRDAARGGEQLPNRDD